jgi:hypothetical protein
VNLLLGFLTSIITGTVRLIAGLLTELWRSLTPKTRAITGAVIAALILAPGVLTTTGWVPAVFAASTLIAWTRHRRRKTTTKAGGPDRVVVLIMSLLGANCALCGSAGRDPAPIVVTAWGLRPEANPGAKRKGRQDNERSEASALFRAAKRWLTTLLVHLDAGAGQRHWSHRRPPTHRSCGVGDVRTSLNRQRPRRAGRNPRCRAARAFGELVGYPHKARERPFSPSTSPRST